MRKEKLQRANCHLPVFRRAAAISAPSIEGIRELCSSNLPTQSKDYFEKCTTGEGTERIAGIDEVGRGPLAGPVVAAAVILPRKGIKAGTLRFETDLLKETGRSLRGHPVGGPGRRRRHRRIRKRSISSTSSRPRSKRWPWR